MVSEKNELVSQLMSGRNVDIALQPNTETTGDSVDTPLDAGVFERELLEDCFNFAFGHGLGMNTVKKFVQFFQSLLDDTVKKGLTLEEASNLIKQRLQQQQQQQQQQIPILKSNKMFLYATVEYLSQTLLQHYHLLKFAFNRPRDVERHECQLNVEVSPYEVLDLAESTQIDQWRMENDLRTEEDKYQVEETKLKIEMEESIQQVEKELEDYFVNLFQQLNNNDNDDENYSAQTDQQHQQQQQHSGKLNLDQMTEQIQQILTSRSKLTSNQLEYTIEKSRIMLSKNLQQALIQNKYRDENKHSSSGGGGGGNVSPSKGARSMSPSKGTKK